MNNSTNAVPDLSIQVPVWWSTGTMMYRRDCLASYHPESTYNYIKNILKQEPERFGIFNDSTDECPECHRSCKCRDKG